MILDLLSTDMYVSFNLKLAHRIGLHASIYLNELLNINKKATQKNKLDENGFFKLDRVYIEQRTTLQKQEQKELDKMLEELTVINIGTNKDYLKINTDAITGLLLDDNSELVEKFIQPIKTKRLTKKESITQTLKSHIKTDNEELVVAYCDWIDAVMARQGWMSVAAIEEGERLIDTYSNRDLDVALQILKIAATNGWRDVSWAINNYERNRLHQPSSFANIAANSQSYNIPSRPRLSDDEVF